ncbi:hypothetical protein RPATATE_0266 [Rickettsia parkeri str. Tate's Hell]|uniref:Uncharacterized protein n=1 Tax=Rickettsia parkeri str. Tate's Hell TaxID=1359189 RepID=A0ABR5DNP4_RICPA|nr:hypothetical protein RPATATE_0266 [Rickettsia parkeri str. Tate's Hell]
MILSPCDNLRREFNKFINFTLSLNSFLNTTSFVPSKYLWINNYIFGKFLYIAN